MSKGRHYYKAKPPPRRRMPVTRHSITHVIRHAGELKIYIIVGFFSNGDPGEVFLKIGKEGSTLAGLMDLIGVQMSQMMQHEIPWDTISRNFLNTNFEPLDSAGKSIAHAVVIAITKILKDEKERFHNAVTEASE